MCSQEEELTLVFDLEVGGDQRWGLTSDPSGEWLSALNLVILYYLDLRWGERGQIYHNFLYSTNTLKYALKIVSGFHKRNV